MHLSHKVDVFLISETRSDEFSHWKLFFGSFSPTCILNSETNRLYVQQEISSNFSATDNKCVENFMSD